MRTPWGPSQTVRELAPGITEVSTAGHGGIKLSSARRAQMHPLLGLVPTWAGDNWYEEDEDYILVVLAFPGAFDPRTVRHAVRRIQSAHPFRSDPLTHAGITTWLESPASELARNVADRWEADHFLWWEAGSMGTGGKGWNVHYTQVGTGAEEWRHVAEGYPEQLARDLPGVGAQEVARG